MIVRPEGLSCASLRFFVCPAWAWIGGGSPLGKLVATTPSEPQGEEAGETGPIARSALKEAVAKPRVDEEKPDRRRWRPGRAGKKPRSSRDQGGGAEIR